MSDTNTITAALEGLRCRERELELEAVAVKARVEEIRDMIERLEPRRRPGRPRNASMLNPYPSQSIVPQRAEGDLGSGHTVADHETEGTAA
jgi:hypothetical protein